MNLLPRTLGGTNEGIPVSRSGGISALLLMPQSQAAHLVPTEANPQQAELCLNHSPLFCYGCVEKRPDGLLRNKQDKTN